MPLEHLDCLQLILILVSVRNAVSDNSESTRLTFIVIDDVDAVNKHYDLLVALMRVICTAVLSRGSQNEQTLDQGRKFLSDNRLSILAVFKRSAGLGSAVAEESIDELADSFVLLVSATEFLEVGDSRVNLARP